MKKLLLLLLLLPTPSIPWDKTDDLVLASYIVCAIDWGQTLDISDNQHYYETNPIMGEHPSRGNVNNYFFSTLAIHTILVLTLPEKAKEAYLHARLIYQGGIIQHNKHIGLKINILSF